PIAHNLTLFGSERRTSRAVVIRVLAAKWIYNHKNLMGCERRFREWLAIDGDVIAVIENQISEGLVTIVSCIKVVMGFIEKYAREVFRERGLVNSGVEMRIG